MSSGINVSFDLGAKSLKQARGLERIIKPNLQEVDAGK